MYFTLLISKMYLIRVLSFIGDVRFNVRGEHVPGCLGRGWGRGLGSFLNVIDKGTVLRW